MLPLHTFFKADILNWSRHHSELGGRMMPRLRCIFCHLTQDCLKAKFKDVSFFKITNKRLHWVQDKENYNPNAKDAVCSQHFENQHLHSVNGKRIVQDEAIPVASLDERAQCDDGWVHLEVEKEETRHQTLKIKNHDHTYSLPITSPEEHVKLLKTEKQGVKRNLYNCHRREKRMKKKILSLKAAVAEHLENNEQLLARLDKFKDFPIDLFKTQRIYSDEQKRFALTLQLYGPKAYEFLRAQLRDRLPSIKTIQKWLRVVDDRPGICSNIISELGRKRRGNRGDDYKNCTLVIDAMGIKQQILYSRKEKKMIGYEDLGNETGDSSREAKEALVLMVVGMTGRWKAPVSFHLIRGIKAEQQKNLIMHAIEALDEQDIRVRVITFDGTTTNQSTAKLLGADFDSEVYSFQHKERTIHVTLDACHMVKVMRNCFADMYVLVTQDGTVCWEYIKQLADVQEQGELHLGNKITKRHVNYKNQIMKVKLAAQVFSQSAADAIAMLRQSGFYTQFSNSYPTERFLRMFDRLFDILNSRSPYGKYTKAPISTTNWERTKIFLDEAEVYIKGICIKEQAATDGPRKTAFRGFLSLISMLRGLVPVLLSEQRYVLTYKMSQDHLELFFNSVRRANGWCNNPTALQFRATMRRMLVHCGQLPSKNGNCLPEPELSPDRVESLSAAVIKDMEADEQESEHNYVKKSETSLAPFELPAIGYMAGYLARKVREGVSCTECKKLISLTQKPEVIDDLDDDMKIAVALTVSKDRGGLIYPTHFMLRFVRLAERLFRRMLLSDPEAVGGERYLHVCIMSMLGTPPAIFSEHAVETQDGVDNHYTNIIRILVGLFYTARIHHQAKKKNLRLHKDLIRNKNTKLIIFTGQ